LFFSRSLVEVWFCTLPRLVLHARQQLRRLERVILTAVII
jgi:hypothetical protein